MTSISLAPVGLALLMGAAGPVARFIINLGHHPIDLIHPGDHIEYAAVN